LGAGEGRALGVRLAGLFLGLTVLSPKTGFRMAALLGAAMASTSFAFVGHVQRLMPNILPCVLMCVHLLCAAFWLGALVPLRIAARGGNSPQVAALASRFGRIALFVVSMLICAGAGVLFSLIDGAGPFWNSGYGRMMAIKLFLVAALLAIAAVNKLNLTPKLLSGDARATARFKRNVEAEIVLGGLILLVTATFTTLAGPPH
jgi:putative copper resistance protein D